MTSQLQFFLVIGSLLFFAVSLRLIKKSKFSSDMAIIWLVWGLGIIFISLFPEIIYQLTALFGFMAPINMLFLFMIFFLYCLVFYLYLKLSSQEDKLKSLIHEVALLKKQIDEDQKKQ